MRWGLSALVVVLVAGGLSPAGASPVEDEPEPVDWWDDLGGQPPEPVAPPSEEATSAPLEQDNPGDVPEVNLPEPGVAEVSLGDEGDDQQVGETPIDVAAGSAAVEGVDLQVEVLDREVTEPAGVSGFGMRVSGGDGGSLAEAVEATDAVSLPVELKVDTAGWGEMYGADYPSRIVVVALPDCALEDPAPAGCDRNGVPVPSHLDAGTGEIVIDIDDLSALDSATLESDEVPLGAPVQVDDVSGNVAVAHETAPLPSGDGSAAAESRAGSPDGPAAEPADAGGSSTTSTTATSTTAATTSTTTPDGTADAGPSSTEGLQGRATDPASGVAGFTGGSAHAAGATTRVLQTGGGSAVLALTSAPTAEGGNWGASPLNLSGDWLVGIGSGEFSWSYQVPVPAAPAGATPSVGLSYSSGSIDGLVTGRNVQAGQIGLGWSDFANAFIERRYAPCDEGEVFHDLCWRSHNATISLNGHQTELVPVTGEGDAWEYWVLKDDPHWRVQRRSDFVPNGDNNGENWRVTSPDGTEYWFGYGVDQSNQATNAAWTVPVFANTPGANEPCRGEGDTLAWCNQAWRWNLDRVVDPDGNVSVYKYFKDTNRYGILNGWGDATYNNSGMLEWIEYGLREGDTSVPPAGEVEFTSGYRCNHLDDPTPCPVPTKNNGNYYKDVPSEFLCTTGCLVVSPTFFSTRRYKEVWTHMRVPGQGYPAVDAVRLNHSMANEDEGNKNLWLRSIQRIGKVNMGTSGWALPPVTFHGNALHNRVDYNLAQGKTPMEQYRVDGVFEEYGRNIEVTYGRPNGCTPGTNPHPDGHWYQNELSCFPQSWRAPGASANEIAVFHKWLVTQVEVNDEVGGSDSVVTTYDYGTTPAWHYNDDEFLNNDKKTWSDWRGYNTARVTVGSGSSRIATRYRIYRGMDHDRNEPIGFGSFKDVQMPSLDGTVSHPDNDWMKGRILDQEQIDSTPAETRLTSSLTEYVSDKTSNWPGHEIQDQAHWVGVWKVTNSTRRNNGTYAQARTETTYNTTDNPVGTGYVANYVPRSVLEEGRLDVTGDERCTRTSYVNNPAVGMYGFPYSQALVAGSDCASTATGDLLRRQQSHYDGGALGAAPTKGHVTKTRVLKDAATDTWLGYTQIAYDTLGRPTSITDPDNHTTTTNYVPDVGNVQSTQVTNALGHQSTTDYMVERGLPASQSDPNGKTTSLAYDALGRLTQVQRPIPLGTPSMIFSYDIDDNREAPPVIHTQQLVKESPATYHDAWVVYDGLLRQRQTQGLSPDTTKTIVASTWYDNQGHVKSTALAEAVPGTAGSGILAPAGGKQWANQSRPVYDELGRVTEDRFYGVNGDSSAIVEHWHTSTAYDFNATWVTPPVGGPTKTVSDAYGNVTSVSEGSPGSLWQAVNFHTTNYSYNLAGDLLTVTDPALNVISYGYDKAGRRTSQDDPDAGDWSYTYDDVGNQLTVTDALAHTITTNYDELNRPKLRHEGATNLASWDYDAPGQKGLLDKSTRITTGGDWVTDVVGYDPRNRPTGTTLTVPAGIPGLSGSYTTSYGYNLADQPTSIAYPAVGGLAAETVTTTYHDTLGLPATMTSSTDTYVGVAAYDNRARPALFGYGLYSSQYTMGRIWTYDTDQRLGSVSNAATGGLPATQHDMVYDPVGNVKQRTTKLGTNNFRECFTYDAYQRLTRAVTTTTTTDCATNPANPSGNLPYEQDFVHSTDGNLQSVDNGTGPTSYTYPAGGTSSIRPHAPTQVGTSDTYAWDANGDLDTRTVAGVTTDFTFDHEHNLATTSSPAGTSSYVYDAGGQRLYQNTPQGSTLYLEGQEVNATPGATPTVTATRVYTFAGQLVATRTAAGGVDYMVTDHQGTVEAKIDAAGTVVSAQRAYKPYGQPRGTPDAFATQRGWIGQIQDPATNLNYLNNRYYDPTLNHFISPDPLYNKAQPKSLNPYTYAWANPTTGSDPSGLLLDCECSHPYVPPSHPSPPPSSGCSCGGGYNGGGGYTSPPPSPSNNKAAIEGETAYKHEREALRAYGLWYFGDEREPFEDMNDPCNGTSVIQQTACLDAWAFLYQGGDLWAAVGVYYDNLGLYETDIDALTAVLMVGASLGALDPESPAAEATIPTDLPNFDVESISTEEWASTRAAELQSQLPTGSQGRITMSTGVLRNSAGEELHVVATSEPRGYMRPGVQVNQDEIVIRGTGHAEADIVSWAAENGYQVVTIGAGRPICTSCATTIEGSGGTPATPTRHR